MKAFAQWDEIFALQSERAKEADNPSHARLILMLAFFFEFSLGFYGPTPFRSLYSGQGQIHESFMCTNQYDAYRATKYCYERDVY